MPESILESKIVSLLEARLHAAARVTSAWAVAPTGEAKGVLTPDDAAIIAVATGAPAFQTYTYHACSFPVALSIAIRRESSPDGAAIAAVMQPVSEFLIALQMDYPAVLPALSFDGFAADGIRLDGGSAPVFDQKLNVWTLDRSFTVSGTFSY